MRVWRGDTFKAKRSRIRERRRAGRLGYLRTRWFREKERRHATPRVVFKRGEWFLHYTNDPRETGTGGFITRKRAIAWYENGGR
jgi:hypothetical protein